MSNEAITRLVVGERYALNLGRPVEQRVRRDSASAIVWKNGEWIITGPLAGVARFIRPRTIRLPIGKASNDGQRQRVPSWSKLAGAIGLLIVVGASVTALGRHSSSEQQLPIAPHETRQSVRVVPAPYGTTPTQDVTELQRPAVGPLPSSLPIAAPSAPQLLARATIVAPPSVPASPRVVDKEARPAAVVLDEAPSTKGTAAVHMPASAAANAVPSGVAQDKTKAQVTPRAQEKAAEKQASPPLVRGVGLVAITPDGRSAVFTNPSTRMPQQFRIGEQLPNGETVRSIDYDKGRVVTTAREYGLE